MEELYPLEISLVNILENMFSFRTFYMQMFPRCNTALNEICDCIISSSQSPEDRYATIHANIDSIDHSYQPMLISLYFL